MSGCDGWMAAPEKKNVETFVFLCYTIFGILWVTLKEKAVFYDDIAIL